MAKKLSASHLNSHIGYWMRLVSNNVSHTFARRLEASGVTVAEWVVLREMYGADDTTNPSRIASLTGLTRGAISKLMSRLVDKGFVSVKEAGGDRRYQDIQLTKAGKSLVPKLSALADKNDSEFFSGLTALERSHLTATLKKLAEIHHFKTAPVE